MNEEEVKALSCMGQSSLHVHGTHNLVVFEQQYSELFPLVYRYVTLRVPHLQDREDVTSEIFLAAYKDIQRFDSTQGNLRQWVMGIAKHSIVNYWRKHRREESLDDVAHALEDVRQNVEKYTEDSRECDRILSQLSPEHRALFIMRYVDDLSYDSIAQRTEKHPTAIRSFFSRAVRKLRAQEQKRALERSI